MQVLQSIWLFFQNQVLGMKWLNALIGWVLSMFGIDVQSHLGSGIQFFVYDTIKIFML